MVRHMMSQPVEKLQVWTGGLPMIIGALATFAVSPYGVMKLTNMFQKGADKVVEHEEHKEDKVDNPDNA